MVNRIISGQAGITQVRTSPSPASPCNAHLPSPLAKNNQAVNNIRFTCKYEQSEAQHQSLGGTAATTKGKAVIKSNTHTYIHHKAGIPLGGAVKEEHPLEALVEEEVVERPQAPLRERVTLHVRRVRVHLQGGGSGPQGRAGRASRG